jgi:hypothetical protein
MSSLFLNVVSAGITVIEAWDVRSIVPRYRNIIEDGLVIEKILRHLGLWDIRNHDPPLKKSEYVSEITYDDSYS